MARTGCAACGPARTRGSRRRVGDARGRGQAARRVLRRHAHSSTSRSTSGTPFQLAAWHALAEIPYGETRSYGEQAARHRRPTGVRAVGAANGRNPISIILPCHRVIGSDGALGGFGGGLDVKAGLLAFEAGARLQSGALKTY